MELPFWSDKDRLFVFWGLGMSLNFKFIVKKLRIMKTAPTKVKENEVPKGEPTPRLRQDHLHEQIEASKYEDKKH